jgi:hypothetical protein
LSSSPRAVGLNYSNWTGCLITLFVKGEFDKVITLGTAYNIIHNLNYSKTRPKKVDKRVNKKILNDFRDKLNDLLESKAEDTVILYEDKAVITSQATTTSV